VSELRGTKSLAGYPDEDRNIPNDRQRSHFVEIARENPNVRCTCVIRKLISPASSTRSTPADIG
jgi:hypothetical protein